MQFTLSEEQQSIRAAAAELADNELAPRAAGYDESEEFTWDSVKKLAELGFLGMTVPEEYGGVGADYVSYALAMEEVARGCAATSVTMTVQNSLVNWPIMTAGNEEQKRKYLPRLASGEWLGCYALSEPAVGSDPAGMTCTATQDGDDWVLNGSKNFISNGGVADVAVVWATTDRSIRHKAVATFIVEKGTPGFSAGKSEHKLGIHGSNTVMLYFENCHIPKTQLLAPPGEGFKLAMKTLDGGRIGVAAQAVGIAQAALDYAVKYAQQRTAFGKPIADLQAIQFKIAEMATRTTAARLLTLQAADFKQRELPYTEQAAMAKLFASEAATFVTHQAVQILGGYGYLREYPVERLYRDARITEIYEGTSEIQHLVIAGQELKARKPATELTNSS